MALVAVSPPSDAATWRAQDVLLMPDFTQIAFAKPELALADIAQLTSPPDPQDQASASAPLAGEQPVPSKDDIGLTNTGMDDLAALARLTDTDKDITDPATMVAVVAATTEQTTTRPARFSDDAQALEPVRFAAVPSEAPDVATAVGVTQDAKLAPVITDPTQTLPTPETAPEGAPMTTPADAIPQSDAQSANTDGDLATVFGAATLDLNGGFTIRFLDVLSDREDVDFSEFEELDRFGTDWFGAILVDDADRSFAFDTF